MAHTVHTHDDLRVRSPDEVPEPPKSRFDMSTLIWFVFALLVIVAMIIGFSSSEGPSLQ